MAIFDFKGKEKKSDVRKLMEIPVASIVPNPNQPRKSFDEESIRELAQSIEQVGLIQPLMVRTSPQGYELIAGERRLRAVKSLGKETVSCIVCTDVNVENSAIAAVIENLQREDLNFFEEAECYRALIEGLDLTQEQLAEKLGKSQSFIANKLRVLKLNEEERELITANSLTERHARAILKIDESDERLKMISEIAADSLSVKATEELIEKRLNEQFDSQTDGAKPRPIIKRVIRDYRIFISAVNSACEALRNAGAVVDIDRNDRDDGMDVTIHITNRITPSKK